MPLPGKRWRHITLGTRGTWLHGDPRGFRNHHHRIHSSGDYRHPPPPGEHADLHIHQTALSQTTVLIPSPTRPIIGSKMVHHLHRAQHRLLVICVAANHAHLLVELPDQVNEIKRIIGAVKQSASRAVTDIIPGRLWAHGCGYTPVDDADHHARVFDYILRHRAQHAWVWSFREGLPELV